jgi:hypothetical protein
VRGNKIAFTRLAAQVVRRDGVAEANLSGGLLAEQDHVGKLSVFFVAGGCFAEDAAGWEDGLDGADNKTGWVESQVTSVILGYVN